MSVEIPLPGPQDRTSLQHILRTRPLPFAVAVTAIIIAFFLRDALQQFISIPAPFLFFYPAVIFAAMYGGFLPGMFATVLSACLASFFWIFPVGSIRIDNTKDLVVVAIFLVTSAVLSLIAGMIHTYHERLHEAEVQLQLALERERISGEMRQKDELLLVAFDQSSIPTGFSDLDFKIRKVNLALCGMLGYGESELVGRSFLELTAPADIPENMDGLKRLVAGDIKSFRMDKRYIRKDGALAWGDVNVVCVRNQNGAPLFFVTHIQDITRRKQAEEQLTELSQRLTYHLQNTPLAVVEFDAERKIVRWGGAAQELFGWQPDEVLGKPVQELQWIHEEDAELVAHIIFECWEKRSARRFCLTRNRHKKGTLFFYEWYYSAMVDDFGALKSVLALGLDVTARKRLEEEMQLLNESLEHKVAEQVEKIHERDRLLLQQNRLAAMGEMVNSIAHQWRQPLNVLGLQMQKIPLFYEGDAKSKEFIQQSVDEAMELVRHMSNTIDDFRNFFRPDKEKVRFSIPGALKQTLNLVQDTFRYNNITVDVQVEGEWWVIGFPNEFCQALLNILENARDVVIERKVANGMVTITAGSKGGKAVITIMDNAGGIAEDVIDHIFEPYFSTKGVQGTGIGLYMTKTIIESNMGGSLAVRNVPLGAEFIITLPEPEPEPPLQADNIVHC